MASEKKFYTSETNKLGLWVTSKVSDDAVIEQVVFKVYLNGFIRSFDFYKVICMG